MTTFTIEQLNNFKSEIVGNTPMNILVEIYNELSPKPIKKFSTKTAGLAKINKLIEMYELELDKVVDSVVSDVVSEVKELVIDETLIDEKKVDEKAPKKQPKKVAVNKMLKSLTERLKVEFSELNIRKFHVIGNDDKVVQNGEDFDNVSNRSRDAIFCKLGRDLKVRIDCNLDGQLFINAEVKTEPEIVEILSELNNED